MTDTPVAADSAAPAPRWVSLLALTALAVTACQIRFPFAGGRLALADLPMAAAFLAVLWWLWRSKRSLAYPVLLIAGLVLYALSAVTARAGLDGGVEAAQRAEQLLAGVVVFAWLVRTQPGKVRLVLSAALLLNLLVAVLQLGRGFGHELPPADVMALPWGFNGGWTALFRSRMAWSLYLGATAAFLFPLWLADVRTRRQTVILAVCTGIVLAFIPHGQALLLAASVVLVTGFLHSTRGGLAAAAAGGLVLLITAAGTANRREVILSTLSPVRDGQLKTAHVELVASHRMANLVPWTGVGPGRYQRFIGACYGELPNPSYNDIDTDTQPGLGILLATAGYPTAIAVLLALLAGIGIGLRQRPEGSGAGARLGLAGAAALSVLTGALLVSDPFTRGIGWLVALGLAAAYSLPASGVSLPSLLAPFSWKWVVGVGAAVGILAVAAVAVPQGDPFLDRPPSAGGGAPRPPRPVVPVPPPPGAGAQQGPVATVPMALDFFRVIDATAADPITPHFVKATDSQAADGAILRIPDKAGTPPDGEPPDMEYGGAAYTVEAPADMDCKIWVRVWWEGSCGNTIFVKPGADAEPMVVGNDGTYDAWHWVAMKGTARMVKGPNTITLLNREDGIRVDQLLITNDDQYYPQGIEME